MGKFCKKCGTEYQKVDSYCGECGTELQNSSTETQMKSGNHNSSVANKSKMIDSPQNSEPKYHISVNCHICKAHFNDADEYEKHISDEYKKNPDKTWLACDFCTKFDHKPAGNSITFISHITTHLDGGGLYKCEFQYPGKKYKCGTSFGRKSSMKNHWKTHVWTQNISSKSSHSQNVEVDVKIIYNTNSNTDNTNSNNMKEYSNDTPVNRDGRSMDNVNNSERDNVKDTREMKQYVDDNGDTHRGRNKWRNKWRDRDTNTRSGSRSRSRSRSREVIVIE